MYLDVTERQETFKQNTPSVVNVLIQLSYNEQSCKDLLLKNMLCN